MNDYSNPVENQNPVEEQSSSDAVRPADAASNSDNMTLPPNWSYETTVAEVEAIINQIERGELDLADVFDQFANAVERLRQCESFLTRQQQQVDLLIETLLDEPDPF